MVMKFMDVNPQLFEASNQYDFHSVEVPSNCPVNFGETMLEDNLDQPVSRSDNVTNNLDNDDRDEAMDAGEEDAALTSAYSAISRENEKLYTDEGMLSTKLRKAEKKMRKKDEASATK